MRDVRILVVGGGASGALLAANLLRIGPGDLRVTIVEKAGSVGAGVAYSTNEPDHLLNTRAGGMSAFPDDPDHFWRWLQTSGQADALGCSDAFCFVPRRVYRAYLEAILAPHLRADNRVRVVSGECVAIREHAGGVAAELADGRIEIAGRAVLATGHPLPCAASDPRISGAWLPPGERRIDPDAAVAIIGTGLSMIDNVAQLRRTGHRGPITAVSRRGLLPQVHEPATPLQLDAADVPFGTSLPHVLRWLRRTVRWWTGRGGNWRDVVDALRPHLQELWQSLPLGERRRFLRHGRTLWEVHRHRMAPEAARLLDGAFRDGQLVVRSARVTGRSVENGRVALQLRLRGGQAQTLLADHVIECTGILRDPATEGGDLVARLIASGQARMDPLGIGLDVAENGALVGSDGEASARLFALGPPTRARFWEITAIPDIRLQAARLARDLAARRLALA